MSKEIFFKIENCISANGNSSRFNLLIVAAYLFLFVIVYKRNLYPIYQPSFLYLTFFKLGKV